MDWINDLAQNQEAPMLSAFALGLLTAIAPCPLATNITATAFIAKNIANKQMVLLSGILYTSGRAFTYTFIGGLVLYGMSKFEVAKILQSNGERYIGFVLIFIGFVMLGVIKLSFLKGSNWIEQLSDHFKKQGIWGAFLLGALFALAFCPYSGALFFAMLIPLTLSSDAGLAFPLVYSLGTGIPVILFAFVIAYSMGKLGLYFKQITKVELIMRKAAGIIFIITGAYYINIFFKLV